MSIMLASRGGIAMRRATTSRVSLSVICEGLGYAEYRTRRGLTRAQISGLKTKLGPFRLRLIPLSQVRRSRAQGLLEPNRRPPAAKTG